MQQKIHTVLTLGLMVFCLKINGQTINCEKFKNGLFKIESKEAGVSYIRRYENYQAEILDGRKDSTTSIVKWVNDCTYTLTPTENTFKIFPSLPKNAILTVTIIETRENSYVQISTANFADIKVTSEVVKLKE